MRDKKASPNHSNDKRSGQQGQYKGTQKQRVFKAFYEYPKTMLMVSVETGILRANICRYVAEMRKRDEIKLIRKGLCQVSKNRAGYYYTNLKK